MDILTHRLSFCCPKDNTLTRLTHCEAMADGSIVFYGKCFKCQASYAFASSMKLIMEYCFEADFTAYMAKCQKEMGDRKPQLPAAA